MYKNTKNSAKTMSDDGYSNVSSTETQLTGASSVQTRKYSRVRTQQKFKCEDSFITKCAEESEISNGLMRNRLNEVEALKFLIFLA